jgi:hypothetical protein
MSAESTIAVMQKDIDWLREQSKSDRASRAGIGDLISLKIEGSEEKQDLKVGKMFSDLNTTLAQMENRIISANTAAIASALTRSEKGIYDRYDEKVNKSFKVASFLTSIWAGLTGLAVVVGLFIALQQYNDTANIGNNKINN